MIDTNTPRGLEAPSLRRYRLAELDRFEGVKIETNS